MNKKESRVITEPEAITNSGCCCTNNSTKKLLNFARLHHNVSGILENNIFEPQILLEALIDEVKFWREEQKASQRAICNLKTEFPKIVCNEFNRLKGGV